MESMQGFKYFSQLLYVGMTILYFMLFNPRLFTFVIIPI